MNLRIKFPESEPLPALNSPNGFLTWISTVDHKLIGIMYLWTALFFLVVGVLDHASAFGHAADRQARLGDRPVIGHVV